MKKRIRHLAFPYLIAAMLLTSCGNDSTDTQPPLDTTSPIVDIVETDAPETEAPETEPLPQKGGCGNLCNEEAASMVGPVFMDHFLHQVAQFNYVPEIKDDAVTVAENWGIYEFSGWISMNFWEYELGWRIGTDNEESYRTENARPVAREGAVYAAAQSLGYVNATGFKYELDCSEFSDGDKIHLFLRDKTTDTVYCFYELTIRFAEEPETADPAVLAKYELGSGSDMDLSPIDPIEHRETVTSPEDDPSLKLWFDHLTEKVARYDTTGTSSDRTDYTIQMAKNEIEGCQFFLYSPTPRKVTVSLSDFTNDQGETLTTELGVEYYIQDSFLTYYNYPDKFVYPDAVVPYESYIKGATEQEHGIFGKDMDNTIDFGPYVCIGPFSGNPDDLEKYPFRESVRGFVIQTETTTDTTPGAYKAALRILDADTGACIKTANVYTYVYDVTLSEDTALDTAFSLWDFAGSYENDYANYPALTRRSTLDINRAVADYFLKQRITLTSGLSFHSDLGDEWFENPRVTSLRVLTKEQYDLLKDNPVLREKMFYYGQDEPGVPSKWCSVPVGETIYDNTGLLSFLAVAREADMLRNEWGWEDYRLLIPFERTIDFTSFNFAKVDLKTLPPTWYDEYAVTDEKDTTEYIGDAVTVWVPTFTGATPRDIAPLVTGEQYMQNETQDEIFGEFQSRLEGFKEKGAELWNYVACLPPYTSPYQNVLLFNDGTENRTMFWTSYMLGSTGFLYWNVSFYDAVAGTHNMRAPFSKTGPGDGILIYPGSMYDQLDPIPSIRLLNMRDGIEEYQMLTMLEEAMGKEYTDELVSHIVTSTVTFTRDDDKIYNVHARLLKTLEDASKE